LQRPDLAGNDPEAFRVGFLAALEQQLHAKADAERGLGQRLEAIAKPELLDALHRMARRADAGQKDAIGTANLGRIGGHDGSHAEPLERQLDRADIAVGQIDDGELHSTPLVLGSTSPSQRMASRSARPNALKQASVLWWSFSPSTFTWIAAPMLSASERKTWAVICVG